MAIGGKKKKAKSGKDPHKGRMTTRKKTMKKKSGRDPHARK